MNFISKILLNISAVLFVTSILTLLLVPNTYKLIEEQNVKDDMNAEIAFRKPYRGSAGNHNLKDFYKKCPSFLFEVTELERTHYKYFISPLKTQHIYVNVRKLFILDLDKKHLFVLNFISLAVLIFSSVTFVRSSRKIENALKDNVRSGYETEF